MSEIKNLKYAGTALSEEEFKSKTITIPWKPVAKYSWATGIAIGRFLNELKNGRLIGRKCRICKRVVIPPRMFCELCFRPNDEWVYLPDTGRVNTFSISYIAFDASRIKEPQIPAVIEIDGTTGAGILHLLGEITDPMKDIKIGMSVKVVWKAPAEREGAITDIKYFRPV